MSTNVENRVVRMEFDNKQFEDGIHTTTKSLEDLKKGLDLKESAGNLSELNAAARNFSLSGMAAAIDNVSSKFTALGIIGITTLVNLTNSAVNAGRRLVSSLTIDPVKTGLDEYETKMNAIQTILTNTRSNGTTLDDVNKALAELNEYADKTIYNFAQMTDNIGKFTATGLGIKSSIAVVKGMSNVAAGFGVDATKMAAATYQMSQALSTGAVKLMDWKSMEQAGMGGEMLQNVLMETGRELGKVIPQGIAFRETLESGWLTSRVFVRAMDKMAKDKALLEAAQNVTTFTKLLSTMRESVQSGWAMSWEHIIGDKDQSTKLLTGLSNGFNNLIGPSMEARNNMLAFWNANGGRAAIIEAIGNSFKFLSSIVSPVGKAFREIFPAMTGERLIQLSKNVRDFTATFKIGADTTEDIKMSFKGLFAVLDIGVKIFKLIATGAGLLLKTLLPISNPILEINAGIGKFLVSLNESIEKNDILSTSFEGLGDSFTTIKNIMTDVGATLTPVLEGIGKGVVWLSELFTDLFTPTIAFAETIDDTIPVLSRAESSVDKLSVSFDGLKTVGSTVMTVISNIAKTIKSILTPVLTFAGKKLQEFSLQDIGALLTGGGFFMFAKAITKGLSSVDSILENFAGILGEVGNTLKAFQLKVKADALLKIAIAVGILAASLIALSFVKMEGLASGLGALSVMLAEVVATLFVINKFVAFGGLVDMVKLSGQLLSLGAAMLLLAGAVKILSTIDSGKLLKSVTALGAVMGMLTLFINLTRGGGLMNIGVGLVALSTGLVIFTGALAILAHIDPSRLTQGVKVVASLMAMIALFINLTKGGGLMSVGVGLIAFATGITILSGALAILGKMDVATLQQGGVAIATLMMAIVAFMGLTKGSSLATSASGLIVFSIGIAILTGALASLGNMNIESLKQGGVAIATMMASIATFMALTRGGSLQASAAGLIGFGIGITVLTGALTLIGNMDSNKLGRGGLAIATIMASIAAFINLTRGGSLTQSSAGLIAFSIGLTILSGAVAILANIDSNKIIQGVTAIATLMATIGVFIKLTKEGDLKESAKGLVAFSAGLMILAGVLSILSALNAEKLVMASVAISALMTAIGLFVKLTNEGDLKKTATGLVALSVGIGIMSISLAYLAQIDATKLLAAGGAITLLLLGIVAFVKLTNGATLIAASAGLVVMSTAIMVMAQALSVLGSMNIKSLIVGIGTIAATLLVLGLGSALLAPLTPVMLGLSGAIVLFGIGCLAAGAGMKLFSDGLSKLSESGESGGRVLIGVIKSITESIPLMIKNVAIGLVDFAKTIGDSAPVVASAVGKVILALINEMVKMIPEIANSGTELIITFLGSIAKSVPKVVQAGIDLIISFVNSLANGLRKNTKPVIDSMQNLVSALIDAGITGLAESLGGFVEIGVNVVKGLIKGMKSMIGDISKSAGGLGKAAIESAKRVLGIHSPSKVFDKVIGEMIPEGMAQGIEKKSPKVVKAVGDMSRDSFNKSKEWIDERKYYNELTLEEELKAWEKIQKQYAKGTEARKQADREVYRVKKELLKAEEDAVKAKEAAIVESNRKSFDNSASWIDERKYYNELSLIEELAAWERVQARYAKGTEERKKADREVYRVKQSITAKQKQIDEDYYNSTKEINDRLSQDIQNLNKEYESAVASRAKTIYDSYGLFDKIEEKEVVSGKELMKNLRDQISEYRDWQRNLDSLSDKGISEDLLQELADMGPKAASQIAALSKLSSSELNQYAGMWRIKHELAKTQAIDELEGLRLETQVKIEELNKQASKDLDAYKNMWQTQMSELSVSIKNETEIMKTEVVTTVSQMRTDTETEVSTLAQNIQAIMSKPNWSSIGVNIVEGMKKGIQSKSAELVKQAETTVLMALNAAKKALGIKSPSRAFAEVGMYAGQGLVNGLMNYSSRVASASEDIGYKAKDALSGVMSKIESLINGDLDMSPTIRPVLDLSNIQTGQKSLTALLSNNQVVGAKISAISNGFNRQVKQDESYIAQNGSTSTITNEFKIGTLVVRKEDDVKKTARHLYNLQVAGSRG